MEDKLLEVSRLASLKQIKKAYYKLARELHPDRSQNLDENSEESIKFRAITEAYNILKNPKARKKYDEEWKKHKQKEKKKEPKTIPTDMKKLNAEMHFKTGIRLFNNGDFWNASKNFKSALNSNPDEARYHSYYGLALAKTKTRLQSAESASKKAIEIDPVNSSYYVNLAIVYKTRGKNSEAIETLKTALPLNPKHKIAKKELNELTKKQGFFGRLFGK